MIILTRDSLSSFFNSYRTALCIEQPPSVIASGALFLAALQLGIRPVNPNPRSTVELTWFALLETDIEFDVLQSKSTQLVLHLTGVVV
jgi:acyl-CoA synthetase (AMP-forming)/AMP-acid ligase II